MIQKNKIAVLGAGTMGPGIATIYAIHGYETALYSRTQATLLRAKEVIESNLALFVEEGMLDGTAAEAAMARICFTDSVAEAVEGAWYVAETIVEKPEPKKELYQQLDSLLPPETIIASNTSYMNIFELMPARRQSYTLISHFYAPAHILPLVEVVKGPETLPCVMDAVMDMHTFCGKQPVRMEKFIPGFIVNRMQSAMTREVLYLIENGYCTAEELDLAVKTSLMPRGLLLGLVQRIDFNGVDMLAHSLSNKKYIPAPEIHRPETIFSLYDRGEYGAKSGVGFYDYTDTTYAEILRKRDKQLLKSVNLAGEFLNSPLGQPRKK